MRKIIFLAGLFVVLGGCREFSGADFLPVGHPADPASRDGQKSRMSGSLSPENQDVRPEVMAAPPPKTRPAGSVPMKKAKDHSAHRGSH